MEEPKTQPGGLSSLRARLVGWPSAVAANLCFFPGGLIQVGRMLAMLGCWWWGCGWGQLPYLPGWSCGGTSGATEHRQVLNNYSWAYSRACTAAVHHWRCTPGGGNQQPRLRVPAAVLGQGWQAGPPPPAAPAAQYTRCLACCCTSHVLGHSHHSMVVHAGRDCCDLVSSRLWLGLANSRALHSMHSMEDWRSMQARRPHAASCHLSSAQS